MRSLCSALFATTVAFSTSAGEELLRNGGFEEPSVTGQVPVSEGGDPTKTEVTSWAKLEMNTDGQGGKLVAGITDHVARTGKQSFFLDFQQLTAPSQSVTLTTAPIPVTRGQSYRVSMWSRIDGKRPLALDERRPFLWLIVSFLKADRETEVAEAQLGAQMIPGVITPGDINDLEFVSWKWTESFAIAEIPADAAFIQASWTWGVAKDVRETDGAIYWDDASVALHVPPPAAATEPPTPTAPVTTPGSDPSASTEAPTAPR